MTSPPALFAPLSAGAECSAALHLSPFDEFVSVDEETNVTILEVESRDHDSTRHTVPKHIFHSSSSLIQHCHDNPKPRLRIMFASAHHLSPDIYTHEGSWYRSISQEDSYSELQIPKSAMEFLIKHHNISPDFLTILTAAGSPPRESEEGYGNPIENQWDDGSFSIIYLSRYYQLREASWKLRQTGVYHAYSAATQSNLFILLHPCEGSKFQLALENLAAEPGSADVLVSQPTRMHALLFNAYFENWRAFLQEKGDSFIRGAEKLFVANIEGEDYLDISFPKLQSWRDLEDRIMPLSSMLQALYDLLDVLDRIDRNSLNQMESSPSHALGQISKMPTNFFASRKGSVIALMTSAGGLRNRIHGVLSLLADTLEMRNHRQLARTNEHLLNLQRENVEDSDTVQIVTVVTLMYLPASFVATLFGMNLFAFNPQSTRIRIASDFWLYVAIMLPLTFITVFYWYIRTKKSRAERRRRLQGPAHTPQADLPKSWFQLQNFGFNNFVDGGRIIAA